MDNIFGKQSSKVALNLMLKTVSGLMKKSDAPITTAALEAALDAGARDLKSRVLKSTSKVASSVAVEGVTGGLQEGANILALPTKNILTRILKKSEPNKILHNNLC